VPVDATASATGATTELRAWSAFSKCRHAHNSFGKLVRADVGVGAGAKAKAKGAAHPVETGVSK